MLIHYLVQNEPGTEWRKPTLHCLPLYDDFYSPQSLTRRSEYCDDFEKLSDLNRHFYGSETYGSYTEELTSPPLNEPEHPQNTPSQIIRGEI